MALIMFTGFDLSDDTDQWGFLSNTGNIGVASGASTRYNYGYCTTVNGSGPGNIDLGTAYSEVLVEFDVYLDTHDSSSGVPTGAFFQFMDEDESGQIALCMISESANSVNVQFRNWASATVGAASTGYPIPLDTWFHISIRVKIHATLGEVEVKIDTGGGPTSIINSTGLDTEYNVGKTIQYCNVRRAQFSGTQRMDNFIAMDTTGGKDNAFKGASRVYFSLPASDGDLTDFTPLSSTNESQVDERPPDEDSTHNDSGTSGHRDCFNFPTWTGVLDTGLDIVGIRVSALARKTDASAISLKCFGRRSAVNYDGSSSASLGDSFTAIANVNFPQEEWTEDPFDASAWSVAKLNAYQWGYVIP